MKLKGILIALLASSVLVGCSQQSEDRTDVRNKMKQAETGPKGGKAEGTPENP